MLIKQKRVFPRIGVDERSVGKGNTYMSEIFSEQPEIVLREKGVKEFQAKRN